MKVLMPKKILIPYQATISRLNEVNNRINKLKQSKPVMEYKRLEQEQKMLYGKLQEIKESLQEWDKQDKKQR